MLGSIVLDLAKASRPTFLAIGPGWLERRGPLGWPRRMAFSQLEEVAGAGTELVLVSDHARMAVPWSFGNPFERAFVAGLVERAAHDHGA